MQCPHCLGEFDGKPHTFALGQDQDGTWEVASTRCPICDRLIVNFCTKEGCVYPGRPALSSRARLSDDVPPELAAEYHTAAQVIPYSPEASAAISRRLLHRFLEDPVGAGSGPLMQQIEVAATSCRLPGYLADALSTLAQAAKLNENETKSARPETLAPTEPGEPEWLLDVLEQLFDLYFVQPARMQRKRLRLEEQVGPLVAPPEAPLEIPEEPLSATLDEASASSEAPASDESPLSAEDQGIPAVAQPEEPAAVAAEPQTASVEHATQRAQTGLPAEAPAERGGWRRLTGRSS